MRFKTLILTISILLILIILNYSDLATTKIWGNGGDYVEYYSLNVNSEELRNCVKSLKIIDPSLQPPNDTLLIGSVENNYSYVCFYDIANKQYFHTWVSNTFYDPQRSLMVLYAVTNKHTYGNGDQINLNYGFVTKFFKKYRFEELVIDKLKMPK